MTLVQGFETWERQRQTLHDLQIRQETEASCFGVLADILEAAGGEVTVTRRVLGSDDRIVERIENFDLSVTYRLRLPKREPRAQHGEPETPAPDSEEGKEP